MSEFLSTSMAHLYLLIFFSIANAVVVVLGSYKYLQILQLSKYHVRGVFTWMKESKHKYFNSLLRISVISFAVQMIINLLFMPFDIGAYISYIGPLVYFFLVIKFERKIKRVKLKKPLRYTKRMSRLCVFMLLFTIAITFGTALILCNNNILRFVLVPFILILSPVLVVVSNYAMFPLEELIRKIYVYSTKQQLKKYDHLIKIGVTGSYGKTSTKYILNTLLSEKYNVLITPHSYNTPMGIVKVLRNMLQPNHQIFIAEMGATDNGDINYMCNFVKPKYGIITNVGNQHLETFGTIENIKKTKLELAQNIPSDGFCVFNLSNFESESIYNEAKCNKIYVKINDDEAFVTAKDIVVDKNGTTFYLKIKDKKEFKVNMNLLGEHNIQNVLEAVALAYKMDVSIEQIKIGLSKLRPVKHRLELIQLETGAVLLDDSFNSNILGTKSALDVLGKFKQKNKIVITPGLIELGNREMIENLKFGKNIAGVATKVYIVNNVNRKIIMRGLVDNGFSEENIVCVNTFSEAWEDVSKNLSKDDVILIENDLPDNYV